MRNEMSRIVIKQHYVTFFSPGTFMAETTTKRISRWNIKEAVEMSHHITERYNSHPYCFKFSTRGRTEDEIDSRELKTSKRFYLGGTVLSLKEIKNRGLEKDRILMSNMEDNGWDKIVESCTPWKWCQPLYKGDVVLDMEKYRL